MIRRLRTDERGISTFEWLGIVLAVLVLLSLIPQFRGFLDVVYENLVGKNNVGPDGDVVDELGREPLADAEPLERLP